MTAINIPGFFGATARFQETLRALQHVERLRPRRRREGAIECSQILLLEFKFESAAIFMHVIDSAGLRNGDDAVLPQHPGERNLCRRRVMTLGNAP